MRCRLFLHVVFACMGCAESFDPLQQPALDGGELDAGSRTVPECPIPGFTMADYTAQSCAFARPCHGAEAAETAEHGLDWESPDMHERLLERFSFHDACRDFKLIDPADWERSFLYIKLAGRQGSCGDPMPGGSPVPHEELDCVAHWIVNGGE